MQDRVKAPAIALIVVGLLDALTGISWIMFRSLLRELFRNNMSQSDFERYERSFSSGSHILTVIGIVVLLTISGFIVFGGIEMMKLRNRPLAITASILAIIPCCDACCPISIPVGIWALIVLLNDEVKRAFSV